MEKLPRSHPDYMSQYYRNNKQRWSKRSAEKRAAYNANRRRKYQTDPEYRAAKIAEVRADYRKHPRTSWARTLRKFGLSLADYDNMLEVQGYGCAICGNQDPGDKRGIRFHVDHCHETGVVRGLLCLNCNTGLGKFGDNADTLLKAGRYLSKFGR